VRILLDHCVDWRLGRSLPGHFVKSAGEMGWERLVNGKLLAAASASFEAILAVDKGIKHQQNPANLPICVVIINGKSNKLADLIPLVPKIEAALRDIKPFTLIEVS